MPRPRSSPVCRSTGTGRGIVPSPSRSGRRLPTAGIECARLSRQSHGDNLEPGSTCMVFASNARSESTRLVWEIKMSISTILLIVLVLLLIGALPSWPYSSGWGYYPSGGLGLVVIIVLILVLMGRV